VYREAARRCRQNRLPLRRHDLQYIATAMTDRSQPSEEIGPLADAARRFGGVTVLVVGDMILDRFVTGAIERISPEAPIPVLHGRSETKALGGAGNVVANITALGGRAIPLSVLGDDAASGEIIAMLESCCESVAGMSREPGRRTSAKSRFSALNQQVLRFDEEEIQPLRGDERARLLAAFNDNIGKADIVVLSDYGKGVLLDGVARELIDIARTAGKPVLADPKGRDFSIYRGATAVTPNRKELGEAAGRDVMSDADIEAAARDLIGAHGIDFIVATRSEKGMSVVSADAASHIATVAREVFDVSGAGDTVVAAFALSLGSGLDRDSAAIVANAAAGVVVGKRGTAQVSADELTAALKRTHDPARASHAVVSAETAARIAEAWKREGLKVGFTNGCFDILHAGHVSLLQSARAACDRLIVGVNDDASTRRLKGPSRPVNGEHDRAFLLSALAAVDLVVLFAEDTPLELIRLLSPDVLVKGADYTVETVVGSEHVLAHGGKVMLVDLVAGRSTTGTIEKMRRP
jgi:D-beta-D-heptose 7-phosphate kinase/D-beta-D-heptose 1-phosphate adenosyltransferase